MLLNTRMFLLLTAVLAAGSLAAAPAKKGHKDHKATVESTGSVPAVLWRSPAGISSRDLYYGPGGKEDQPQGPFTFVKEDLDGSNPKFVVHDDSGVKWKVKLGEEARPETAASRFVWSIGYFANEDYFLSELQVQGMPVHLHRGQKLVRPGGVVHAVRLKRYLKGEEKVGTWRWRQDPFTGTRELNGLRVLMAVINNWDLKDENNAAYEEDSRRVADSPQMVYLISDLGSSFGTAGPAWPHAKAKGNLDSYVRSKFITKVTPEYVDFQEPARPSYQFLLNLPEYFRRRGLEWIGRRIPRSDARWVGQLLAQLSPSQIRDAFRASGFSPEEVEGFAQVMERRITALTEL